MGFKNSLTMSEAAKANMRGQEAEIRGLYHDQAGLCTWGIGHLVHKSHGCYLIEAAKSDPQLKTKLAKASIIKKKAKHKAMVTYLPNALKGTADLAKIEEKAIALATAKLGQDAGKQAVQQETKLLGKIPSGQYTDDLKPFVNLVNSTITDIQLEQDEFDALVMFVFNVGQGNYLSSILRTRVNKGDHRRGDIKQREHGIKQIEAAFKSWNKITVVDKTTKKKSKQVSKGLTHRRQEESNLFLRPARKELHALKSQAKSKSSSAGSASSATPKPKAKHP
jgi:GH24 family phage-related lysozyme (muramidase)